MPPSLITRIAPLAALLLAAPLAAQEEDESPAIEVSGMLVEEAYNQEPGQVQQIVRFQVMKGGLWSGDYTQEWPLRSERHQLDLEVGAAHHDGLSSLGAGYRYTVLGDEDAPLTVSPGLEIAWGREEAEDGGTENEWELELALPASLRLAERLTSNTSLGVAFQLGEEDAEPGYTVGQGLFWRATPRLNLVVEAVWSRGESPFGDAEAEEESLVVSPGLQYAVVLREGLQVVPGIAFPIGAGPSEGKRAVMLYFSVEHPFRRGER